MRLDQLIAGMDVRVEGDPAVEIRGITDDSRRVEPGFLFIARRGSKADGSVYVPEATGAGAVAVLGTAGQVSAGVATVFANEPIEPVAARLSERLHGDPTSRLTLIGVTGTNGKTTTAHLIHQMLSGDGRACGLIGTVRIDDGVRATDASLTTPPAAELSEIFARMVGAGCGAAVMEVSSHALHQGRVAALAFDVGIFTNLTGDHLDYHGTMGEYAAAKAQLFAMLPPEGVAIVNAEDPAAGRMLGANCRAGVMWCWVSDSVAPARLVSGECRAAVRSMTTTGTAATFTGPWGAFNADLRLVGRHNVMNALQAVAACHAAGLRVDELARRLSAAEAPPGRLEPVTGPGDPFTVLVDYAHSDDALRKVLGALRPLVQTGGRLRVVFGCGGDRDRTKRPRMGAAAAELADDVYITSDNPRTERPRAIIDEILAGVDRRRLASVTVDEDRRTAIRRALDDATSGDLVLIAGKGHETCQIIPDGSRGTVRLQFDDRVEARAALARRSSGLARVVVGGSAEPAYAASGPRP